MKMDVVDDITSTEAEDMSKVFTNPTTPIIYSLSQELLDRAAELALLEKKIVLGSGLLAKVNDPALISKLEKEKQGFEEEKINLTILIKKLKYIKGSIEDFTLFFIFIRRFHTLAIKKENFEPNGNISSKLIGNLKAEEENLYNEFIDGDCFSKVLLALSFETYQCYFKEYAKNFFDNIQRSTDPYVNSLLILMAIFYECTYFNTDNFNLINLKFFLSKNIPINIPLPDSNYELVALRCFFFYELLLEYLKLKTVKTHLDHLKKSVNLQLNIVNYKANTKNMLIYGLNEVQKSLNKIEIKYNNFLGKKSEEDKEANVNKALVFYNKIEDEIQIIYEKTTNLINSKYINSTKMRRMLSIIVNETHLSKFLELFNTKIGNDFTLNEMRKTDRIETNQEALNYLFQTICRDEFYTPLNNNLFINKLTEAYSKEDISVLDSVELEDLIEFSFYYIFTLLYTDFNASLKGFNSKLLYTEMLMCNIFINLKCKSIEIVEKIKNEEISKFLKKNFKNKAEYTLHKKNILEEIKLNLERINDTQGILSNTKSLETSLTSKLESSLVPMPEKNSLIDLLKSLEKKQKEHQLEYEKLEKHTFINKYKSERLSKANEAHSNKAMEYFYELLSCLSENLAESLNHIKANAQDINQFRQKISSIMGQISSSIQRLSASLASLENIKEIQDLSNLSLPKLLELTEELVIKNILIRIKSHKKKLIKLISGSRLSIELLIDQVNLMINKYQHSNDEAKKILTMLSTSFIENHSTSQFFAKSLTKKMICLKEQAKWLEELIRLIKCDTDNRVIKSFAIIKEKDARYCKIYSLLDKKIKTQPYIKEKNVDDDTKVALPQSIRLIKEDVEKIPVRNLSEEQSEKFVPRIEKSLCSQDTHIDNSREHSLLTEILKSTDECNKIRTRFEGEYTNKERTKADLKAIIPISRYNFLMSRIDPLNTSLPTSIKTNADDNQSQPETSCLTVPAELQTDTIETNIYNNHPQLGPAVYLTPAPIMFYPAPMPPRPTVVVDTYCLESRTVFYSI